MGKKRIIAETGTGQRGVVTATVAAHFGRECVIYMGAIDLERQALNVARMRFLGAQVVAVTAGQARLKEAINERCATGSRTAFSTTPVAVTRMYRKSPPWAPNDAQHDRIWARRD